MKLFLFGPSDGAVTAHPELQNTVKDIIADGTIPQACKRCSDKYGASDALTELGCEMATAGDPVFEAIQQGYTPMSW